MRWVLLFFCVVFGLILLAILLFICSTIRLNIDKLNISNLEKDLKKKLEKDIQIFFELYLFGKIKILRINLNNSMLKKIKSKTNFDYSKLITLRKERKILKNVKVSQIIKKLKLEFQGTNLDLKLGTEDIMTTVFTITFITTILSILFRNADQKEVSYKVMPLYKHGNYINLHLNCIIKVKVVHIISVLIYLIKEGKVIKNERASNRGAYDYSYE